VHVGPRGNNDPLRICMRLAVGGGSTGEGESLEGTVVDVDGLGQGYAVVVVGERGEGVGVQVRAPQEGGEDIATGVHVVAVEDLVVARPGEHVLDEEELGAGQVRPRQFDGAGGVA